MTSRGESIPFGVTVSLADELRASEIANCAVQTPTFDVARAVSGPRADDAKSTGPQRSYQTRRRNRKYQDQRLEVSDCREFTICNSLQRVARTSAMSRDSDRVACGATTIGPVLNLGAPLYNARRGSTCDRFRVNFLRVPRSCGAHDGDAQCVRSSENYRHEGAAMPDRDADFSGPIVVERSRMIVDNGQWSKEGRVERRARDEDTARVRRPVFATRCDFIATMRARLSYRTGWHVVRASRKALRPGLRRAIRTPLEACAVTVDRQLRFRRVQRLPAAAVLELFEVPG
jgi:hypothetical protein